MNVEFEIKRDKHKVSWHVQFVVYTFAEACYMADTQTHRHT